jgi:hypothetical protein
MKESFELGLKIPEDVVDVVAQTKQLMKDTTNLNISVKRFKEMARAPKEKKKSQKRRFEFQDFLISKDSNLHSMVKDVGSEKINITI